MEINLVCCIPSFIKIQIHTIINLYLLQKLVISYGSVHFKSERVYHESGPDVQFKFPLLVVDELLLISPNILNLVRAERCYLVECQLTNARFAP